MSVVLLFEIVCVLLPFLYIIKEIILISVRSIMDDIWSYSVNCDLIFSITGENVKTYWLESYSPDVNVSSCNNLPSWVG